MQQPETEDAHSSDPNARSAERRGENQTRRFPTWLNEGVIQDISEVLCDSAAILSFKSSDAIAGRKLVANGGKGLLRVLGAGPLTCRPIGKYNEGGVLHWKMSSRPHLGLGASNIIGRLFGSLPRAMFVHALLDSNMKTVAFGVE